MSIVRHALVLVARHWPALVLVYLLGAAGHNGLLWVAVRLSEHHATMAGFLLPLVPICTLTALILMLRHLAPHLPHVAEATVAPEEPGAGDGAEDSARMPSGGWRARLSGWRDPAHQRLNLLASTLIPFLTVYVSQQYLKGDKDAWVNAAFIDEETRRGFDAWGTHPAHYDRIFIATGTALVAIVGVAFVLCWLLDRLDMPRRGVGWGLLAAYVEVLWVFLLAKTFSNYQQDIMDWVRQRQFTTWGLDRWQDLVHLLGPVGHPVDVVAQWVWGALGRADDIVVIPIAWLTVGAVVYGTTLEAKDRLIDGVAPGGGLRRVTHRLPAPVLRAGREATASVRDRFSSLGHGLRLLAVAGLVPMLLFCLVFLLARQVEFGVAELLRWLLGPRDFRDALAFSPHLQVISRGAYTVVLVSLLGAAIDRILGHAGAAGAPPPRPQGSPATVPATT